MGRGTDHVEHDFADSDRLIYFSHCIEFSLKDINCSIDKFLSELFNKASHAGQTHLLKLDRRILDDVKDNFNECIDHLSQYEQLIVDDALPDLARLGLDCIDLIMSQDEH